MKKIIFIFIGIFSIISCTNDILEINDEDISPKKEISNEHKITEEGALKLVNKLFVKTRSNTDISVDYVLNKNNPKTRTCIASDTLAYIFNFNNNNGFAIIASDDRVFPLLAFSDTGHFTYEENENNPIYVNFISVLDDYMATINDNDTSVIIPDDYLSTCCLQKPLLKTYKWHQQEPYDKYVIQEHPGCPVGCVAIATGQIMINCGVDFYYHDFLFRCNAIIEATKPSDIPLYASSITPEDDNTITYSSEEATDHIAKLLYWIGKDLHFSYNPPPIGSAGSSYAARNLFKETGFYVSEQTLEPFSAEDISKQLDFYALIYVDGRVVGNTSQGHAWIIDGYGFCWKDINTKTEKTNFAFHCDWGWEGYANGYYSGEVFETPDYNFGNMRYFSVKRFEPMFQ